MHVNGLSRIKWGIFSNYPSYTWHGKDYKRSSTGQGGLVRFAVSLNAFFSNSNLGVWSEQRAFWWNGIWCVFTVMPCEHLGLLSWCHDLVRLALGFTVIKSDWLEKNMDGARQGNSSEKERQGHGGPPSPLWQMDAMLSDKYSFTSRLSSGREISGATTDNL